MKPVLVGQVGLGEWGVQIGKAIMRVPTMNLIAVHDIDAKRASDFAENVGAKQVDSYEEMLDMPELEAVIIASPNHLHFEQALAAAGKSKHIFVEKPLTTTLRDAQAIIDICQKANLILEVGHNVRHYGIFRQVRDMIQSCSIGKLVLLEANRSMPRGFLLKPGEWRWYQENLPGGVLSQLGIHMIDTFQFLAGPIKRVYAMVSDLHLSADIVDTVVMTLEFESGALGYVGSSYVITESFVLKAHGTKGSLLADVNAGLFMKELHSTNWKPVAFTQTDAEVEELKEFAECVRCSKVPQVSGEVGLRALQVALGAMRSASNGQTEILLEA